MNTVKRFWALCLDTHMKLALYKYAIIIIIIIIKFFRENISIYLHFVSFLHIDTTQVVEILPQIRQELAYSTYSIYHGCWCPGDVRSLGISSHDIDLVKPR